MTDPGKFNIPATHRAPMQNSLLPALCSLRFFALALSNIVRIIVYKIYDIQIQTVTSNT